MFVKTYTSAQLERSRNLSIVEAALEHLISTLVTGSFLATLTGALGFSDSLTGILSSVIALGCLFQLLSLLVRKHRVKKFVLTISVLNKLLFMLLYLIPLTPLPQSVQTGLFVVLILSAYLLYNLGSPKQISWLLGLVDDQRRGRFTAAKEIVSLIAGMVFSFLMGRVTDHFAEAGQLQIAFALAAGVIFLLMVGHFLSLLWVVDKPVSSGPAMRPMESLRRVLGNRRLLRAALVIALYNIANYVATPFYGTYQIHELGFSLTFVSLITMCGSVIRIFVARAWGRYADRNSFAKMMRWCLVIFGTAQLCAAMAVPSNGRVMFCLYYILHGIAMGGMNSSLTNMVFDYADGDIRADSLAMTQAAAGVAGFLATLCVSPLVSYIQGSGSQLFGIPLYAQQVVSLVGMAFSVTAALCLKKVICSQGK